jgi:hypothetical protein
MKRRWRLPRRSELRRAAVARLVRDYRMLVIAAAATTPGEPEDVASAIEATYEAVQRLHPWTARQMRAAEVRRLSDGSFAFAAELGVKSLDLQRPAVLEHRRELDDLFTVTLGTRWNAALDDLRILHEVAWEAGRTFHDAAAGNPLHEVLARLHARGLAVVGEILCLLEHGFASGAMADVDWLASRVRVADNFTRGKFDSPKSHEGRSVPMADRLARELELHSQRSAYRTDDDLVFCHPHTGNVLDPSKMRKRFREAITRAGVREITFHELRHTFGTQMAAAGAPLRAIQEWMGHADAKTTEIYRHYAPDPTTERNWSSGPSARPSRRRRMRAQRRSRHDERHSRRGDD